MRFRKRWISHTFIGFTVAASLLMLPQSMAMAAGNVRMTERSTITRAVAEVTAEGYQWVTAADGTVTITGYTGTDTELTVPGNIDGKVVTGIGERAFSENVNLTKVILPVGMKRIEDKAFYRCRALTELELPDGVTYLGSCMIEETGITSIRVPASVEEINCISDYGPFAKSSSLSKIVFAEGTEKILDGICSTKGNDGDTLTEVMIPESVTEIGNRAFRGADHLEKITLPAGIKRIGDRAFYRCRALTKLELPDGVTYLGQCMIEETGITSIRVPASVEEINCISDYGPFARSDSLREVIFAEGTKKILDHICSGSEIAEVTIPEGITEIGMCAFYKCKQLTSVKLPATVINIGSYAFQWCSSLSSVTMEKNAEVPCTIQNVAFSQCTALREVALSDNVVCIEERAFSGCTELKALTLPENLTSLGQNVIEGTKITEITIPAKVKMAAYALKGCTGLAKVTFAEGTQKIPENICADNSYSSPQSAVATVVIPEGVTEIGNSAFSNNVSLTDVNLPNTITSIGSYAFQQCSALSSVTMEKNTEAECTIQNAAFSQCTALTEVALSDNVVCIKERAFSGCTELGTLPLPENLTSLGQNVIEGTKITEITIPAKVETAAYALNGCTGLTKVMFAAGIQKIPENICADNSYSSPQSAVTTVVIPEGVTEIGDSAFLNSVSLASADLPSTVTDIGNQAFSGCVSLRKLVLPGALASIGISAFQQCSSLSSVTAEENAEAPCTIQNAAFSQCTALTEVALSDNVVCIEAGAFSGCTELKTLPLPEKLTSLGVNVIEGTKITEITIPAKVETATYALGGCTSLVKVTFFEGTKKIPESICADNGYSPSQSAVTTVVIPEGVTEIGASAFLNSVSLADVNLPNTITRIGSQAFSGCVSLEQLVLPEELTSLGQRALNGTKVSSVKFPRCFANGSGALEGSSLKTIEFTDGMKTIPTGIGYGASTVAKVIIPETVTTVGQAEFDACTGVEIDGFTFSYAETYAKEKNLKFNSIGIAVTEFKLMLEEEALEADAEVDIVLGKGKQFTADILPENATHRDMPVLWESSDETVATVDQDGKVQALTEGTATVTARMENGYKGASCTVHAKPEYEVAFSGGDAEDVSGDGMAPLLGFADKQVELPENTYVRDGYVFGGWTDGEGIYKAGELYTIPEGGITLAAAWKKLYSILATATTEDATMPEDGQEGTEGGSINPAGDVRIAEGESQTFTVSSEKGYIISEVLIDGQSVDEALRYTFTYTFENVTANHTIEAVFAEDSGIKVEEIILSDTEVTLEKGEMWELDAEIIPGNADYQELVWYSSDTDVAEIDAYGEIKAIGTGVAEITAESQDKSGVTASCTVTVVGLEQRFTGMKVYRKTCKDGGFDLDTRLVTGNGDLSYSVSDETVATVTSRGYVEIAGAGETEIIVSAAETEDYRQTDYIVKLLVSKDEQVISGTSLYEKKSGDQPFRLDARLVEGDGTLSYTSSNTGVAAVTSKGQVTVQGAGEAAITIVASETEEYRQAQFVVTVKVMEKPAGMPETPVPETPVPDVPSAPEIPDEPEKPSIPSAGKLLTDSKTKAVYRVLKKGKTVEYKKPANKKVSKVSVPATIKLSGVKYTVTGIAAKAFSGCTKLKSATIGKNVDTIGEKAFYKCKILSKITVPAKVKKIGKQAFYGCTGLKLITVKTEKLTAKTVGAQAFKGIYTKATFKTPKKKKAVYKKIFQSKGAGKKVKIK